MIFPLLLFGVERKKRVDVAIQFGSVINRKDTHSATFTKALPPRRGPKTKRAAQHGNKEASTVAKRNRKEI